MQLVPSPDDLARTQILDEPAPLVDAVLSVANMRKLGRRAALAKIPEGAEPLFDVVANSGRSLRFIDPVTSSIEEGMDIALSTPRRVIESDVRRLWGRTLPPTWVRGLIDDDRESWQLLENALRIFYQRRIEPYWEDYCGYAEKDVERRSKQLQSGGLVALLPSLHPGCRWTGESIIVPSGANTRHRLGGNGIVFLPTSVWHRPPIACVRPEGLGPHTIIYNVDDRGSRSKPSNKESLEALIGATRARILRSLRRPCGTAELATRIGMSPATASQHARSLRNGGLITTRRTGRSVVHTLTDLGAEVVGYPLAE